MSPYRTAAAGASPEGEQAALGVVDFMEAMLGVAVANQTAAERAKEVQVNLRAARPTLTAQHLDEIVRTWAAGHPTIGSQRRLDIYAWPDPFDDRYRISVPVDGKRYAETHFSTRCMFLSHDQCVEALRAMFTRLDVAIAAMTGEETPCPTSR